MTRDELAILESRLAQEGVSLRQLVADEMADRSLLTLIQAYETLFRWVRSINATLNHLLIQKSQPPKIASPYLTATEAAAYLRLGSVKKLYGLIERGKVRPLPGSRKLRFTKDILDEYLSGEQL